ncbi:MAG: pseudouridine synthase [Gammaproteobacteria bacterium]|jgi:23S rRNA pseudouridine2457 synthase|nr:pseudouridine synthase [Gammaproteobacteria bacterium]
MAVTVIFNKPFRVLSQFRASGERTTLAEYFADPTLRVAGRLDYDSEGLLVLTDQGRLLQRLTHPRFKTAKTYWAQVEGIPDEVALTRLATGITLKDGPTLPATVRRIAEPANLWPRQPPIRYRAAIPTTWLEITLREGRNRQVRRMTAAIGHPTLRLIRCRAGGWSLGELQPGEFRKEKPKPQLNV